MPMVRSIAFIAVVCLWSTTAAPTSPASPEQMVCLPAVLVVAAVTEASPPVSIPEYCEKDEPYFCGFEWPLTIMVDRILASRKSKFSQEAMSRFQRGSIFQVRVKVIAVRSAKGVKPGDGQGEMWTPYSSGDDAASALRQEKFIFGLFDEAARPSQIWSMSFQARLERTLIEAADNQPEDQDPCPSLIK
jgi:hypothetical protein